MAVQRIEVITGAGRRRSYSAEEKIRLVGEAHGRRGAVAAVARRHGVCTSLLYRWRRQLQSGELSVEVPAFVPMHVLEGPPPVGLLSPAMTPSAPEPAPVERRAAQVEVVFANGRVLRVAEDITPATLRRLVVCIR